MSRLSLSYKNFPPSTPRKKVGLDWFPVRLKSGEYAIFIADDTGCHQTQPSRSNLSTVFSRTRMEKNSNFCLVNCICLAFVGLVSLIKTWHLKNIFMLEWGSKMAEQLLSTNTETCEKEIVKEQRCLVGCTTKPRPEPPEAAMIPWAPSAIFTQTCPTTILAQRAHHELWRTEHCSPIPGFICKDYFHSTPPCLFLFLFSLMTATSTTIIAIIITVMVWKRSMGEKWENNGS